MAVCTKCGKEIDGDSRFCPHCGWENAADRSVAGGYGNPNANREGNAGNGEERGKKLSKRGRIGIAAAVVVAMLAVFVGIFLFGGSGRELAKQLDLGNRYLEEMDYEQAVIAFTNAIEIDPMSVDARLGLVETYIRMGEFELALEAAEKGYEATGDERLKEMIDMIESGNIFDSLGRMMKRVGYDDGGNIAWWHTFTYNLEGWEASVTAYNGAGGEIGRIDLTYDEEGHQLKGYSFNSESGEIFLTKQSYEDGRIVRGESYHSVDESELDSWQTFEYDENGRETGTDVYNADGTVRSHIEREYNDKGERIEERTYFDEGNGLALGFYNTWEYDGGGNCIRDEWHDEDGSLLGYTTHEYNAAGKEIEEREYDRDGALKRYWLTEYDEKGYVIRKQEYDGQGNLNWEQ